MKLSKNGLGLAILVLATAGLEVSETDLMTTINTIGQVVSFLLMIWNQWDRQDVKAMFFKV